MSDNHAINKEYRSEFNPNQSATNLISSATPMVSICIPSYNGARYIRETLESCLNQTYSNVEIIITDDGSTDGCKDIIQAFAEKNKHVSIFHNEKNLGLVGNWKRCIEMAKGDWIKLIFQDDILQPNCVEKMMQACLEHNTRLAICARQFIFEANADERIKYYYINELSRAEKLFTGKTKFESEEAKKLIPPFVIENVLGEPICTIFHRSLYEAVGGYNSSFRQIVDYEFALKCILTEPFCMIPEELVQFRVHGESTTGTTHAGSEKKSKVSHKMIQSSVGDFIRIVEAYRSNPTFNCFLTYWGEERLNLLERYLYLRACKYLGAKKVRAALADLIQQNGQLQQCKYHLLYYKWVKHRYKKEIRPFMNQYNPISNPALSINGTGF